MGNKAYDPKVDYHALAIKAAGEGNWGAVDDALGMRELKVADSGNDYGKTSTQIRQELYDQYGGPASSREKELAGMINELKGLYSGSGNLYSSALEEQKRANQAAVDQTVNSLNGQKQNTETQYSNMYKQLYLNKMKNKKGIGQQLAAAGMTGGLAESTLLGLDTSYDEALRKGEESKSGALGEIDRAITDARLTGDISNANAAAESAINSENAYSAVLQNLINRNDNLYAQETASKAEEAANNKAYAYQTAMQILSGGNMASDELLSAAGISRADAQAIVNQAVAARKSSSSATPKTAKYTQAQAEAAAAAYNNGSRSPEVVAILEGYYGMPVADLASAWGISGKTPYVPDDADLENAMGDKLPTLGGLNDIAGYDDVRAAAEQVYITKGKDQALAFLRDAFVEGTINEGTFNVLNSIFSKMN